jgi:hypothetical protein
MAQMQFAGAGDDEACDDFGYAMTAGDVAGLGLSLSVFADRARIREELEDDALAAGFRVAERAPLTDLLVENGTARPLGDVVLVDCPRVDAGVLAALARLDVRAAHAGAQLVVSTSVEALDDVFGCLDSSSPQILVSPGRAERLIALGQVMARLPGRRVRELSEADRLVLLRLTERVTEIGSRLEHWGLPGSSGGGQVGAINFEPATRRGAARPEERDPVRLPDAKAVRRLIRQRQQRARYLPGELFADPAWDMLLDLAAAKVERIKVSVTSLCIASGVPPTTALRWIGQMSEAGLLERQEDCHDRRRAFIALTDKATEALARYFAETGTITEAQPMVAN